MSEMGRITGSCGLANTDILAALVQGAAHHLGQDFIFSLKIFICLGEKNNTKRAAS